MDLEVTLLLVPRCMVIFGCSKALLGKRAHCRCGDFRRSVLFAPLKAWFCHDNQLMTNESVTITNDLRVSKLFFAAHGLGKKQRQ